MSSKSVIVIGGGLAGLSAAVALADAGFRVRLLEQKPYLGGRASSYTLPTGEQVDNCQHVTLGCCTNLDDFYRRVGAASQIEYFDRLVFVDGRGRRSVMQASSLPPPLHLAPSLARFASLTAGDKLAIARAMLSIAHRGGRNATGDAAGRSMLDWLRLHRQTPGAIANFWSVVLVSALNEELARTEARYGLDVFWKAFLSSRAGYRIGVPRVPLSELYGGCRSAIEARGGEVALRSPVRALHVDGACMTGVETEARGRETADYYILAVPHPVFLDLVPPQIFGSEPVLENVRRLKLSPITGVHFWFDADVMDEPFLALLGRTAQWVFNKSRLLAAPGAGRYLQLVVSASYDLVPRSREEIVGLCLRELREVLPAARNANVVRAAVIKETAATYSPEPGSDRWRPLQCTRVANLFLAGDWTNTAWPATMEGAVRSGYLAAEALLAVAGLPQRLIRPDLPPEGLARFLASRRGAS